MEPIINHLPSSTETIFRRKFDVDDLPTENHGKIKHADTIMFNDHEYTVVVKLSRVCYCAFLNPVKWSPPFTVEFSLRAFSDTEPVTLGPMNHTFTSHIGFGGALVRKSDLRLYTKDGKFTVDTIFSSASAQSPFDFRPPVIDLKYTDFIIKHKDLELPCHKFVVARESKVIDCALSDESTQESREGFINIGLQNATEENVQLLHQFMYEGWSAAMDDHAIDLVIIGDCYRCQNVVESAIRSLKRQLSDTNFWATCDVAVLLKVSCPTLLKACAEYATSSAVKIHQLTGREENASPSTSHELGKAIAKIIARQ